MRLSEIKAGDVIVLSQAYNSFSRIKRPYLFATVLEVGKAKIKTNIGDFSAKRGHTWGSDYYSSPVDICERLTVDEAKKENISINLELRKYNLSRELNDCNWQKVSLDKLEKISEILKAEA